MKFLTAACITGAFLSGCGRTCGTHSYATQAGGVVETEDCSNFGGTSARRFESLNLAMMSFDENTGSVSDAVSNILDLTAFTTVVFRFDRLEEGALLSLDNLAGVGTHDPTASGALPVESNLSRGTLEVTGARKNHRYKIRWDLVYGDDFQTTVGEKWIDFDTAPVSIAPFERPPDYDEFIVPAGECAHDGDLTLSSDEALRAALPLCSVSGTLTLTGDLTDVSLLSNLESAGALHILASQVTRLDGLAPLTLGELVITDNLVLRSMEALDSVTGLTDFTVAGNTQLGTIVFPSQQTQIGQLVVEDNVGTATLQGLEQLTSAGEIRIASNRELGELSAPQLASAGNITVFDNVELSTLDLSALQTAASVHIGRNTLTDLDGLSSLVQVDSLNIETEHEVLDLDGLDALATVDGALSIRGLSSLAQIDGFPALTTAATLDLSTNAGLTAITGFPALSSLQSLTVTENPTLDSLGGFAALDDLQALSVRGNPVMTAIPVLATLSAVDDMEVQSCNALATLFPESSSATVSTLRTVNNAALQSLGGQGVSVTDTLDVDNSPLLGAVGLGLSNPSVVRLVEVGLADLTSLSASSIGELTVAQAPLTSLTGLETTAVGQIWLQDLTGLVSLAGLAPGTSMTGISLLRTSVANLDALTGVQFIDTVHLETNGQLTSITGLSDLQTLGLLTVLDAPLLTDAPSWSSLTAADQIWLQNTGLGAVPDLPLLTSVTFDVTVRDNPDLTSLDGLDALESAGGLTLRDNPQLSSLSGLTSLATVVTALQIQGNAALCQSQALRVSDQVSGGSQTVSGNLDGC